MNKAKEHDSAIIESGQNQIAQILKEFEMGCDEAIIRREGKRLILEPKKRISSITKKLNPLNGNPHGVDLALLGTW